MDILKEVTVWDLDYQPNHVYHILDNGKCYAYQIKGEGELIVLSKPGNFEKRGRKFVKLKRVPDPITDPTIQTVEVKGSKGNVYTVTLGDIPKCSCPGFTFRGNCKHIAEAKV